MNFNYQYAEGLIYLFSGILSAILLALSITAYRKRFVKKILYAIIAFGFFSFYLYFESLEAFYPELHLYPGLDIFAASIVTLVLIFFFLAIIKRQQ